MAAPVCAHLGASFPELPFVGTPIRAPVRVVVCGLVPGPVARERSGPRSGVSSIAIAHEGPVTRGAGEVCATRPPGDETARGGSQAGEDDRQRVSQWTPHTAVSVAIPELLEPPNGLSTRERTGRGVSSGTQGIGTTRPTAVYGVG